MPPPAPPLVATKRSRHWRFWQWVWHHATALLSTAADYTVMVGCVELAHMPPVGATAIAAFAGAVTNFTVNRHFTYHAESGSAKRQLLRFALVSGASLGLNVFGEFLFQHRLHIQYLLARVITSIIVSNAWNYPLMRFFVFSRDSRPA
jgi:putative flippase GtrA